MSTHTQAKFENNEPDFTDSGIAYVPARKAVRGSGPTCVDLFSGAGGLAEGFRQAGWQVLAANDYDEHAAETFLLNFPEAAFFFGSITDLCPKDLRARIGLEQGELDCLIGGPPCQSFSYNNHHRNASDERSRLFMAYLATVEELKPKTLLMENVPGMLTIGDGKIIKEIFKSLRKLGYRCDAKIVYAEEFGLPQTRRRLFIVGTRQDNEGILFPDGTHGPVPKPKAKASLGKVHAWGPNPGVQLKPLVTVEDAIGDLPELASGGGSKSEDYPSTTVNEYQRAMRGQSKKLYDHIAQGLSDTVMERIKHVPSGGNWRSIPRHLLPPGMARAKTSDHTKRYGRLDLTRQAATVLTKCDPHWGQYIHPTQDRALSVREAARLQGFPDTFRFAGQFFSKHYQQVGNAVPVVVARAFGKHLATHVAMLSESNG